MDMMALQVKPPQFDSPIESQGKALQLRQMVRADEMAQFEQQQRQQSLRDDASYRTALQNNPDGGAGLLSALAGAGNYKGHAAAVKADVDRRKDEASIDETKGKSKKSAYESAASQFELVGQLVGAWATSPTVSKTQIQSGINAALHGGAISPEIAQAKLAELEQVPEDVARLNDWAKTTLMQITKSKDQFNLTTVDANTAANNATSSANNRRSNATALQGQRLVDNRAREYNAISREASASQVVETPQGFQVVNKGTGMARPVSMNGQPVLGKDSTVAKNSAMANQLVGMIPLAKQLLNSGATSSGAGALVDKAMAFTGTSTVGSDSATALETLGGWMTSNVPRFEGPQSDKDTETYKIMAGLVGDRTKPIGTRMKALDTMQTLMQPYMGQPVSPHRGPPGTTPAAPVAPRPPVPSPYGSPAQGGAAPTMESFFPTTAGGGGQPPIDSFFISQ